MDVDVSVGIAAIVVSALFGLNDEAGIDVSGLGVVAVLVVVVLVFLNGVSAVTLFCDEFDGDVDGVVCDTFKISRLFGCFCNIPFVTAVVVDVVFVVSNVVVFVGGSFVDAVCLLFVEFPVVFDVVVLVVLAGVDVVVEIFVVVIVVFVVNVDVTIAVLGDVVVFLAAVSVDFVVGVVVVFVVSVDVTIVVVLGDIVVSLAAVSVDFVVGVVTFILGDGMEMFLM